MQPLLGRYLRQLRSSRNLSQAQTAQAARIDRATLSRWENGKRQPHKSDLEFLLGALAATPLEREKALRFLGASASRQGREEMARVNDQSSIGPMPHTGMFLRALRMRCALSQEEAASRVGVTERTLRRWEKLEVWPSPSQIQILCHAYGAHADEIVALTTGQLAAEPENAEEPSLSLSEIIEQAHQLFFTISGPRQQELKDLRFLLLEMQAWPLALRSERGLLMLSQLYGFHAGYLASCERWDESGPYANRALILWPTGKAPDQIQVMAALVAARSSVYRGVKPTPDKGLEILRHWIEAAHWPNYQAWLLSEAAEYEALIGNVEVSLHLVQHAVAIAARCENPFELYHRELDQARALVRVGKVRQSLELTERNVSKLPALSYLVEIEAFLRSGTPERAQERLQKAIHLIESRHLIHLRPRASRLASLLGFHFPVTSERLVASH